MRRYVVVLEESAQADVRESYDWGRRIWGKHEAEHWVRKLRKAVREHRFPVCSSAGTTRKGR